MRSLRRTVVARPALISCAAALVLGTTGGSIGCGRDTASRPTEPTLPQIDFTAKLVLEVSDDAVTAHPGPRPDDTVRLDPPTVPDGSVIEVRNRGTRAHRLRAGTAVDTGILRPGESMTAVVSNRSDAPLELPLTEVADDVGRGVLVVRPPAG